MLVSLSIRDVVLIDRLDLTFDRGLCVLTGETGAGKSILLDALGLALGARAEARLVRHGAPQASVAAAFEPPAGHGVHALIADQGLDLDDSLILVRRTLSADGRSRAWVNDQPASVGLLRRIGRALVEVHGQFDTHGLLDPASHRSILDAYGVAPEIRAETAAVHAAWRTAENAVAEAAADLARARQDEAFLRHALEELETLDPKPGEEAELAASRSLMQHGEKLLDGLDAARRSLQGGDGVDSALHGALGALARIADKAEGCLDPAMAALERALVETAEGLAEIDRTAEAIDLDPRHLEWVEERLFALRAAARKHGAEVDALAGLCETFAARVAGLEDGGARVEALAKAARAAREDYLRAADRLSQARQGAAERLDAAVTAELPPLKLEKARFATAVEVLETETAWTAEGRDRVAFHVATNPGTPPGPLDKIASGGELARFMLALKACLADADPVPTLVFDEVDSGVGGAVAHAVGERLARLASGVQVLVVTHSPQVAARGKHHWRVSKAAEDGTARTTVLPLDAAERREELARMLAGAEITEAARAAADSLLAGAVP